MKILLLGEYSNVHWTLSEGLKSLGHQVTVISDGDHWKDYKRDVSLRRKSLSILGTIRYLGDLIQLLPKMRNYDVVQLINPVFLDLKAERIYPIYHYLRKYNRKVFMGAFGMDYYWVKTGLDCTTFRYSDFNLGNTIRESSENEIWINDWLKGEKGKLNRYIAADCDGIISGLYEYYASYRTYFPEKLCYIPFPIKLEDSVPISCRNDNKIRFFIGIQKTRSAYKGTDIMLRALERLARNYPTLCEIVKVESVPFAEYKNLMNTSDVLLDQLYSYTPAMNALLAMAKGLIVVSGGEPENYEILQEDVLRPIINVQPNEEDVYCQLKKLVENPDLIPQLSQQSIAYIKKHHDHEKVALQYLDFWSKQKSRNSPASSSTY